MKKMSSKIMIIVVCCSCISVILAIALSLFQVVNMTRDEAKALLRQLARTYSAQFSTEFYVVESKVQDLDRYLRDTVDMEAIFADKDYIKNYSQSLVPFFEQFANSHTSSVAAYCYFNPEFSTEPHDIYFVDSNDDGKAERQAHIPLEYFSQGPVEQDDKYWWYGAAETGQLVWTNPYEWTLQNGEVIKVVSCAKPVVIAGKLIAVVGSYYRFDTLVEQVGDISVFDNGFAALTNEKLDYVVHPEYHTGTRNNSDNMFTIHGGQLSELAGTIANSESGVYEYRLDNQRKMIAYATLDNGWKLLLHPVIGEVYAPIHMLIINLMLVLAFCIIMSVVVAGRVGEVVSRPILHLVEATRRISKGDFDVRINLSDNEEMAELSQSFNEMAAGISSLNRDLAEIAYTDSLTGMGNKHYFERKAVALLGAGKQRYAYVLLDIDKFKLINDLFGYEQGDMLLQYVAKILSECTFEEEIAARVNADCFHLLYIYNNHNDLEFRLQAIAQQISLYSIAMNEGYKLNICFGAYVIEEDDTPSISLSGDRAKLALEKVKGAHTFSVSFYNDTLRNRILQEQEVENMMEESLGNGEFKAYLQPKYDPYTNRIVGSEALMRWVNPQRGVMMPDVFIPVFERNGFIADLDFYVLDEVCKLLRAQMDEGITPLPVSVNQSRQYLNSSNYIRMLTDTLERHSITPNLIELEITETAFFEDQNEMIEIVNHLHDMGFVVSLDDFGSGYSSFNMLQDIMVDVLKIDKNFFRDSVHSRRGKKIVANIVSMAHELGMKVVAEGVETAEQIEFLRECGCDTVQGYYYSRPLPQVEMTRLWSDQEQAC